MSLTEEEFLDRLAIEAKDLMREEPTFRPVRNRWTHWVGELLASEGFYVGGVFVVELIVPREYPFAAPNVRWRTPTWHVNIFKERVCVGILGKDWTPANSLVDVVETLRFLLSNPNPDDPLNNTAQKEFLESPSKFEKRCRDYVERFATWAHAARLTQPLG